MLDSPRFHHVALSTPAFHSLALTFLIVVQIPTNIPPTSPKQRKNGRYCNSMTIGRAGFSAPLARRRYWSGIRGCLYADFGVGLFPAGAMFNHSCRPNCSWSTVIPAAEDASGSSVPAVSTSAADRAGMAPMLRVVVLENIPAGSQLFIS